MEVGFLPKLDVYQSFGKVEKINTQKVQKISETNPLDLLKKGSETSNVKLKDNLEKFKFDQNLKPSENFGVFSEVKLYNSDFGFNNSSKDFFIKVSRGTFVDSKYPTDELMRLKTYLNNLNKY